MSTSASLRGRIEAALARPVPTQSLAVYRILFGSLLFLSTIRFMASGWIEVFFVRTRFHFTYSGFDWVRVLPEAGMWALYSGIAASALLIALGLFTRPAAAAFLVLFAYAELIDVTNYLNHYYLVVLMGSLLLFLPSNARWSLDARFRPGVARAEMPAWMLYLLRFQVAVVYLNAALAKVGVDWLIHGQPMRIWLAARDETPILGSLFAMPETAILFSWAGFLFDFTIVGWLLWKRTRPAAFLLVLVFHGLTQVLFDIGIFPLLMLINSTLFFDPDWPRRFFRSSSAIATVAPAPLFGTRRAKLAGGLIAAYAAFQILFPLRHRLYPGDVIWHEQGMRWSWKVMVREKSGSVTYHVRDPISGRAWQVSPSRYLIPRQELEMSGQPDLILQLARRIAADQRKLGRDVEVRAEARVSLNGRASRLLIDPSVDLAKDLPPAWILPGPGDPPPVTASP